MRIVHHADGDRYGNLNDCKVGGGRKSIDCASGAADTDNVGTNACTGVFDPAFELLAFPSAATLIDIKGNKNRKRAIETNLADVPARRPCWCDGVDMRTLTRITLLVAAALLATSSSWAQNVPQGAPQNGAAAADSPPVAPAGRGRGRGQAQANPNVVSPSATPNVHAPDAPPLPYHFVQGPVAPNGEKFGNVSAVALTPAGHLLVFNRNPAIMMVEYDAKGKFIRTFNPNIAINTHGMRVDRHGNIWVLDSFLNVIWKLNPKGEPLMTLGTRGQSGAWDEAKWNKMFNQPMDVAFDKDDNIYVSQSHGGTSSPPDCPFCSTNAKATPTVPIGSDPRIMKFDKNGNFIASRPLPHADGTYPTIHTVIVTPKGEVWVSDRQLNKIIVLDQNLKPLREIQEPNLVSGLFVDAKGVIWMSAGMDGMIMKLDSEGKIVAWAGQPGRGTASAENPNLIGEAHYLVVTPDEKTIYVADSTQAKVHRLEHN